MVSANVFDSILARSTRSQIRCDVRAAAGCLDIIWMQVGRGMYLCVCVNREQIFAHFLRVVVVARFVRINYVAHGVYIYYLKWVGYYYIIGNQCVQMKCVCSLILYHFASI